MNEEKDLPEGEEKDLSETEFRPVTVMVGGAPVTVMYREGEKMSEAEFIEKAEKQTKEAEVMEEMENLPGPMH